MKKKSLSKWKSNRNSQQPEMAPRQKAKASYQMRSTKGTPAGGGETGNFTSVAPKEVKPEMAPEDTKSKKSQRWLMKRLKPKKESQEIKNQEPFCTQGPDRDGGDLPAPPPPEPLAAEPSLAT